MATAQTEHPLVNDKREIFGWAMYDWANSAFSTTIGTVFLGPYVASLAANAASLSPDKMAHFLGIPVAADSFFPYCISISVLGQVFFLPIMGAIADYSHRLVVGRRFVHHCESGLWRIHRLLQFLPAGYRL